MFTIFCPHTKRLRHNNADDHSVGVGKIHWPNGLFTLTETDSGADSVSDSKPDGNIVLCRTFHFAQTWTRIPTIYFCVG